MKQGISDKDIVLIVGAGPSGLLTAKYALDQGFQPIILEQQESLGGLWNPNSGGVWSNMSTNLSKYTCCFQNHPWAENTPLFPSSAQMFDYIRSYAEKYGLFKYIKFSHKVTQIKMMGSKYHIQCQHSQGQVVFQANYLVICSGIFSQPYIPTIPGLQNFQGEILHSKFYRNPDKFVGKKVIIVGGSFTAIQLVSDIAKSAKSVVHCFRRPFWVLEHFIKTRKQEVQGKSAYMPIDFSYNRAFYLKPVPSAEQKYLMKNGYYSSFLCSRQKAIEPLQVPQSMFKDPINVTISSNYLNLVEQSIIKPVKAQIEKVTNTSIIFSDGQIVEDADCIIFCTGYHSSMEFLPKQITSSHLYSPKDTFLPLALCHGCYLPPYNNLFFVGMYKGPYFGVMQLQARLAFKMFKNPMIGENEANKEIKKLEALRNEVKRPQFPYEYIPMADNIATLLGQMPKLSQQDQKLGESFFNMAVFPAIPNAFSLRNTQEQINESQKIIDEHTKYI